jgi:hypothetical protein
LRSLRLGGKQKKAGSAITFSYITAICGYRRNRQAHCYTPSYIPAFKCTKLYNTTPYGSKDIANHAIQCKTAFWYPPSTCITDIPVNCGGYFLSINDHHFICRKNDFSQP